MKNALILHGAANNSSGNWFSWLKEKLEDKGFKVWSPNLPNSKIPVQKDWLDTIFSNKDWQFGESLVIGHSAGATLILRILENLPEGVRVGKVILVAGMVELGTKKDFFKYKQDLVKNPFRWEKIKKSCRSFVFINSDNDPYECGERQGKIMQRFLGGELIIKKGEGHFNLERSLEYKRFPLLLELI